jgi:hypothetical protein
MWAHGAEVMGERDVSVQSPLQPRARVRGQRDLREAKQEARGPGEQAAVPSVCPHTLIAAVHPHLTEMMFFGLQDGFGTATPSFFAQGRSAGMIVG